MGRPLLSLERHAVYAHQPRDTGVLSPPAVRRDVFVGRSTKSYPFPSDDVALDRDDFRLAQSKIMTAIYFNRLERDSSGKPRTLFRIPL